MHFTEKYRPKTIADLRGQDAAVFALSEFMADPTPCAWLFSGESGCGKTSAAHALARDLGCVLEHQEFGGLHEIASGEQTADSIRAKLKQLWTIPWWGKGWKCLIVNECDRMHPAAETIWLDALEKIPPHTVIVFTTNAADKLTDRFRDRCTSIAFTSDFETIKAAALEYARDIWRAETGLDVMPPIKLAGVVVDKQISFRRLVSFMGAFIQQKRMAGEITPAVKIARPETASAPAPAGLFVTV